MMRIRTALCLLTCCAALAGCAAGAPKGPDTTVTTPAVGRPPAPDSALAAMSREAFTPYAGLGTASDDGLAPGETYSALHTACMNDAGYGQYAASAPFGTSGGGFLDLTGIGWVIAGGESGPGFRPLDLAWVRDLRDRCGDLQIPFFFKQVGGVASKAGGRLLDGRTWDEYPSLETAQLPGHPATRSTAPRPCTSDRPVSRTGARAS